MTTPNRRSSLAWLLVPLLGLGLIAIASPLVLLTADVAVAEKSRALKQRARGVVARAKAAPKAARRKVERIEERHTVEERVAQYGPDARARMAPWFEAAGVAYPPERLVFVALKREKRLEIYAEDAEGPLKHVHDLPILKASGKDGPKLRRGDRQVPEGVYGVDFLNPNSTNHLSMRVTYPSAEDAAQARVDGRKDLGGEIYIHGKNTSIGCLAMGDRAAEELFVLAADTGIEDIEVLIAPLDLRRRKKLPPALRRQPRWMQARYVELKRRLDALPPR